MIDRHINWIPWSAIGCGAILFFIAVFFTVNHIADTRYYKERTFAAQKIQATIAAALDPLALSAQGILIYDATNQMPLYQKRAQDIFPVASVTKLATAITALENSPGVTPVVVRANLVTPLDPGAFIPAGTTFTLNDLVAFMLATSSNDAAAAIADFSVATIKQKTNQKTYFQVVATKTMERKNISSLISQTIWRNHPPPSA